MKNIGSFFLSDVVMQLAMQYFRSSSILLTFIGVSLLFVCSQIGIPLTPVPITLQTVAVLIIGLTFAKAEALKSVAAYLALGALGLPMFSNFSGGLASITGPTGGYLIGFFVSVWVMCSLRERMTTVGIKELLLIGLVGSTIVFMLGVPWLSAFIGWKAAVYSGFLPFVIPGLAKSVMVAAAVGCLQK
jgi:biotin transport system substrate-specific component